jgi:proton-dependent oligopeptide transporter, POT family
VIKLFGKKKPINSMIIGGIIVGLSMIINLGPIFLFGGVRTLTLGQLLPLGSLFAVFTVALIAFGELFAAARQYEYIGALAPKGQEGLFLGYANLPMAIGSFVGGPVGAFIFNGIMCRHAVKLENGLLDLNPMWNSLGWIALMSIGLFSAFCMWMFNRWLQKHPA